MATADLVSYNIQPPEFFNFRDPANWTKWKRRFERFREASFLDKKSGTCQVSTLLYCMGDDAEDILGSFNLSEEDVANYEVVIAKFESHFIPRRNVIYERAKFNQRKQQDGESVDIFITALYALSEHCGYNDLKEEMIRDRLVVGLNDRKLSESLQLDPALTLGTAITKARQKEAVVNQQAVIRPEGSSLLQCEGNLAAVNQQKGKFKTQSYNAGRQGFSSNKTDLVKTCFRCGNKMHNQDNCPAKNAKCLKCKKVGHFARVCQTKEVKIHEVRDLSDSELFLGEIKSTQISEPWRIQVILNERPVDFKIDSGADVTAIPESNEFPSEICTHTEKCLFGPERQPLQVVGKFTGHLQIGDKRTIQDVYIVKDLAEPLLGRPAIEELDIVRRVDSIKDEANKYKTKFPTLFKGLGCLKGEYTIRLRADAEPFAIHTPRRVPIPLLPQVKEELQRMEEMGVISKIETPTEWCAGMVVVRKKNNSVRICVDLTQLNKSVLREKHILPTVEQTLAQLSGARIFTKLDANSGFWQVKLSADSAKYTTFITPFGRYCFNRMPFGISSAPEYFQRRMTQELEGLEGQVCQTDDILIFGDCEKTLEENSNKVLQRLVEAGITLNDKCEFAVKQVDFLGFRLNSEGIEPDPSKVKAIIKMRPPVNQTEVRRFLGMTNHVGRFIPNLSETTKPLRDLLVAKNSWCWDKSQEEAFENVKQKIVSAENLAFYDPKLPTIVSADASSYGLGAVLLQIHAGNERRPVAFASKALNPTEGRYAQVEKEAYAITWACDRFNCYLIGLKFHIETDHKPLIPLLGSMNLDVLPPRIQRFRMRMMRFDYSISYVPGKLMATADTLSRAPVPGFDLDDQESFNLEVESYMCTVLETIPASSGCLQEIEENQKRDNELRAVIQYTKTGWPHKSKVPLELKPYWKYRGEFSLSQEGLLLKGCRLVIPKAMRVKILNKIHEGHQGITKCRSRAKESVWWPGLSSEIPSLLDKCEVCLKEKQNKVEPLLPTPLPLRPWERCASDLFDWKGSTFLLVVDYYSKFIEVALCRGTTSRDIIVHLKSIFARYGVPKVLVTDNGPQYKSGVFEEFARLYDFQHITSSPGYPQSNGEAERAVRTIKKLLTAEDAYGALLAYRSTPGVTGFSPAELLMGRKLRTPVPVYPTQLDPKWPDLEDWAKRENHRQFKQKQQYDCRHGVKNLQPLGSDSEVWICDRQERGTIRQAADTPRSYVVDTPSGQFRRNRKDLIPTNTLDHTTPVKVPEMESPVPELPRSQKEIGFSEGTLTRSGRLSIPPKRLDL